MMARRLALTIFALASTAAATGAAAPPPPPPHFPVTPVHPVMLPLRPVRPPPPLRHGPLLASAPPVARLAPAAPIGTPPVLALGPGRTPSARLALLQQSAIDNAAMLDGFASQRYRENGAFALASLRALGPSYAPLIADAGIVARLPAFRDFVRATYAHVTPDPWAARAAFAKTLPTRTMYRALALTEAEHQVVLEHGIASRFERGTPTRAAMRESLSVLVNELVGGDARSDDPILSVSEVPEVATAVARDFVKEGRSLYLYKLEIPALDILVRAPAGDASAVLRQTAFHEMTLAIDEPGKPTRQFGFESPEVESFVLYDIAPSEIVASEKIARGAAPSYRIEHASTR